MYQRFIHLIHAPTLRRTDLIKTNQHYGSNVALRAARFWRKPLIVRGGYVWSQFMVKQYGVDSPEAQHARRIETSIFHHADAIVLTAEHMRDYVQQHYSPSTESIIIPNYVDTTRHRPLDVTKEFDVGFVGRLESQKNPELLLQAIATTGSSLLVVGDGTLREQLQRDYAHLGTQITWQGTVPHAALPALLNRCRVYVLPSQYEGHPKTLLEAMACSLPVIGTNVVGIREAIEHGVTGWLCEPTLESIVWALQTALHSPQRAEVGHNARRYIQERMALDIVAAQEYALYQQLLS